MLDCHGTVLLATDIRSRESWHSGCDGGDGGKGGSGEGGGGGGGGGEGGGGDGIGGGGDGCGSACGVLGGSGGDSGGSGGGDGGGIGGGYGDGCGSEGGGEGGGGWNCTAKDTVPGPPCAKEKVCPKPGADHSFPPTQKSTGASDEVVISRVHVAPSATANGSLELYGAPPLSVVPSEQLRLQATYQSTN